MIFLIHQKRTKISCDEVTNTIVASGEKWYYNVRITGKEIKR